MQTRRAPESPPADRHGRAQAAAHPRDARAPVSSSPDSFGRFLLRRGLLRPEQLIDALDRQRREQEPIGRIALHRRILRVRDVVAILDRQALAPHLRFGEIGVALGVLTEDQVAQLLGLQQLTRPPIGEVLVGMGVLTAEQLEDQLAAWKAAPED